ncbi:MAG: T9SS type A sorting domain-containing protein [Flavobacteriales bacterium]
MKKLTLTLMTAVFALTLFGQQIQDFTKNDCDNNTQWNLYTELGNGYACLLDFMATWCGPCASSTPAIMSIYTDYGGANSTNFRAWSFDVDNAETCSQILAFHTQNGGGYPSFKQCQSDFSFYDNLYGSGGIPLFVLIIPNTGNPSASVVDYSQVGWASWVETNIRDHLTQNGFFPVGVTQTALDEGVHVFPNPANGTFNVTMTKNGADMRVELYNVVGQQVATLFNGNVSGQKNIAVRTDDFDSGMYFVKVIEGDQSETIKLMIK